MSATNYHQTEDNRPPDLAPPLGDPQRSSSAKWLPIGAVVLLLGLLLMLRSRHATPGEGAAGAAKAATIPTVKVMPVSVGNIEQKLVVTGTLRTNQSVDLGSKISGRVARVYVKEGDRVRRGQLLVQLEDNDLRAQAAASRAAYLTAQLHYRQAVVGLPARIQGVNNSIEQASTALETAQARYQQALLNEPARVQQANTAVQQAQALLATARARYQQALLGEPTRITTAQAQLASARESVSTAQARVAQARETAGQTQVQTEADIRRAEAALASSQAGLADVQRGARVQQVAQAQSQVAVQEAQLHDAETELTRAKALFAGGAAPRSSVDSAQTRYDVTNSQLEAARQNLSLVREGATNEQVAQAQQGVRQSEALLSTAQAGRSRVLVAQSDVTAALGTLAQAQEGLRTAQSNLSQIPITRQETLVARQGVDTANEALAQARANQAQIPISHQDTRVAQQAVEQARQTLTLATANRSGIPLARGDVGVAAAAVQAAAAQFQQAEITVANAHVLSPLDGVVNTKLTEAGQIVGPNVVLLNLVSLDRVYFEAQVSETNVRDLHTGQGATVVVPAVAADGLQGYVTDIIPVADPKSRQFRVRVTIPSAPRQLTPGAFARGSIVTQSVGHSLIVPADAVQDSSAGKILLVAIKGSDGTTVKRRHVQTGVTSAGRTQITGGVQSGDLIITNNPLLEDGDKVKTVVDEGTTIAVASS